MNKNTILIESKTWEEAQCNPCKFKFFIKLRVNFWMEQWRPLWSSLTSALVPCIIPKDSLLTDLCTHPPCPHPILHAAVRTSCQASLSLPFTERPLATTWSRTAPGHVPWWLMALGPVKGSVVTQVGETVHSTTTLLLEDLNKLIACLNLQKRSIPDR